MKTLTIRDFRTRPRAVRKTIAEAGEVVLTVNGKPLAVLLAVDGELEETVSLVERVRAQRALQALRDAARASGASRLPARRIEALVREVRRGRRARRPL